MSDRGDFPPIETGAEFLARTDHLFKPPKKAKAGAKVQQKQTPSGNSPQGDADSRPTITLQVGETERAVNQLESLLVKSTRGLYQRGGLIVSTGFAKMQTWDGKTVAGQVIEERGDYALVEDAEAVAKFVRSTRRARRNPRRRQWR